MTIPRLLLFTLLTSLLPHPSYAEQITYRRYFRQHPIDVKIFKQQEIAPYTEQLYLLCKQVYQEYPYLFLPSEKDGYSEYFKSLPDTPNSLACIAFDKGNVIGAAIGLPIRQANSRILEAFDGGRIDLSHMYYLGELVLLPKYRKQGIGRAIYYNLETAVKEMNTYNAIALCQIEDPRYDSLKPKGYVPNDHFWKKLGFVHHPQFNFNSPWVNVNQTEPSPHHVVFWIKTFD